MIIPLERFNPIVDKEGLPTLRTASFLEELVIHEGWHEIGAINEPVFENSWDNESSGSYNTAAFYKDPFNRVYLKGVIDTGSSNTTAFTLPKEYRPDKTEIILIFSSVSNISYLGITASGAVKPIGTDVSAFASLDGISFRVN